MIKLRAILDFDRAAFEIPQRSCMAMYRFAAIGLIALATVAAAAADDVKAPAASKGEQIPELNWEPRADWINVKTADPAAKGDGIQDDTAAIQAALNRIQDSVTIYFPPGTYRITKTLESPAGRFLGVSLLGHGRTTTLAWDGEAKGRMFWNRDGMPYTRYIGLTWDGRGKAAVGFDHSCLKVFETEIRHQHEAYRNFTEAGIRVGYQQQVATAETLYENCLFENCQHGLSLWSFNVLDHTLDGCEFRNCGVGLHAGKGTNFYVRNSHFEQSAETDIVFMGEAGSSIRKCTSHGSKQFVQYGSSVGPLTIEDCHVDAWTSTDNAIALNGSPVLIFDCVFTHPPAASPLVSVLNPEQRLLVCGNRSPGVEQLVKGEAASKVIELPAGKLKGVVKSADQRFLKSTVAIPGKVFDVKRDFGAKGDGATDDTAAITKAIEAARAHGQGAIAYLPGGQFAITQTLVLTGSDYYLGGSGFRSSIVWSGPAGGTTIEVREPDRIRLQNIGVGHHDARVGNNAIDILQVGSDKPTSMTYDRVWVWGMYQNKPLERGLRLVNLGKQEHVQIREMNGNLHFTDSAAATIFLRLSYEGTLMIDGKSTARDGFIGGAVRLGTITDPAVWLKDNQSLVVSDLYVESSAHHTRLEGDAQLPAGRLVLQGAKYEIAKPENNGLEVQNYRGEVTLGPYQFYVGNPIHHFVQQGDAPFALTLLGCVFYNSQPEFRLAPSARLGIVGVYSVGLNKDDTVAPTKGVADVGVEEALGRIATAFDDLRRLNAVDAQLNYPD